MINLVSSIIRLCVNFIKCAKIHTRAREEKMQKIDSNELNEKAENTQKNMNNNLNL